MTPHPAILLGLRADDRELRDPLEGAVRRLGFQTRFTTDVREALAWLRREEFAASFVDSDMGLADGEAVWRTLRPAFARRTVLLARDRNRGLWFEALRSGVATVLPLPAREPMVRAALAAAMHAWRGGDWRRSTADDTYSPWGAGDPWDTN
jgi:DNA-binding NtrC family response regulator